MAFNLGAFAGGLAQGGLSTYKTLSDIEAQKKEAELREAQLQAIKDERTSKEALRNAIASSGDISSTTPATEYAGPAPANAPQQGGYVAPAYTAAQKTADFQRSAIASGADPTAVQSYMSGSYQLRNAQREADFNDQFDTLKSDWDKRAATHKQEVDSILAKEGAQGVLKKYGSEFTSSTGNTLKIMGNDVIVTGKDGKPVDKFPVGQFPEKLNEAMGHRYVTGFAEELAKKGMFKNADSAIAFMHKQQELANQSKTAEASMIGAQAKADTVASENARNFGAANYYNSGGRQGSGRGSVYDQAKQMVADGEAKDVQSAIQILKKGAVRDAVEEQWNKERAVLQGQGVTGADMAQKRQEFLAEKGFAPQAAEATLRNGFGPDGKTPATQADIDAFNRRFPHSAIEPDEVKGFKVDKTSTTKTETTKTETALPKASRTSGEANPYVDKSGRPLPREKAPAGAEAPIAALPGAVKTAVTSSGNASRAAYLQGKIDRNETLDPIETMRARDLGLIK